MSGWFEYLDRKTKTRPSHKRFRPVQPPNPRSCEGLLVEEKAASDSMIVRIRGAIAKLRG
jgi:hypothetical protein